MTQSVMNELRMERQMEGSEMEVILWAGYTPCRLGALGATGDHGLGIAQPKGLAIVVGMRGASYVWYHRPWTSHDAVALLKTGAIARGYQMGRAHV
jgi:hypothetical protein